MPKTKISEYSQTAASNTDIDGININEGCAPSTINNAIRELMAQIKDFQVGAAGDGLTVSTLNATTATFSSPLGVLSGGTGSTTASDARTSLGAVGLTDTQTLTNKTVTNLVFDGSYTEEVFAISDGGSVDLNPANGTIQTWTLGANRSPTATNFAAGQSMTLLVSDGSDYTITWPSVTWVGGSAPTLATTGFTVIELWKVSTTLYGALVGGVA
jgi:hypothetical protein